MKLLIICLFAALLTGCLPTVRTASIVRTSEAAKAATPFCDVARASWGKAVDGDPGRTQAQKAAYNAAGQRLDCPGFK